MSALHATDEHRACWALLKLAAGRTPAGIADHLHGLGIRGDHRCDTCPIATYIKQETGLTVRVARGWWQLPGKTHRWTLPQPITGFVNEFDRDQYPQLRAGTTPEVIG